MSENILAEWVHNPNSPKSGVNFRPLLPGQWEDEGWQDAQDARCSNNRRIQIPIGETNAIQWSVESAKDNSNVIRFNVSIDLPGSDPVAWWYQGNKSVVAVNTLPPGLLPPGLPLQKVTQYDFYIASVQGANMPFTVKAIAVKL